MTEPKSDVYTHGHHASVVSMHATRTAENSAAYLLEHLSPHQRLLDVGCGPGTITSGLARRVAEVLAIDVTNEIVATAAAHLADAGVTNARAEVASVYELDIDDDAMDVVHLHQVLQHLTDPVAALRECHRVLRPGGLLAARDADYATMIVAPKSAQFDRWLDLYHQVAYHNGAEPDAARYLGAWARAAGFSPQDMTWAVSAVGYTDQVGRSFWGGGWEGRARSSAFASQAVEYGLAEPSELEAIAQAWAAWVHEPDGFFCFTNGELLARKSNAD